MRHVLNTMVTVNTPVRTCPVALCASVTMDTLYSQTGRDAQVAQTHILTCVHFFPQTSHFVCIIIIDLLLVPC